MRLRTDVTLCCSGCPDELTQWSGCYRHRRHQGQGRDCDLHHQSGDHLLLRGRPSGGSFQLPGKLASHQNAPGKLFRSICSFKANKNEFVFWFSFFYPFYIHCYFGQFLQNKNIVEIFLKLADLNYFHFRTFLVWHFAKLFTKTRW